MSVSGRIFATCDANSRSQKNLCCMSAELYIKQLTARSSYASREFLMQDGHQQAFAQPVLAHAFPCTIGDNHACDAKDARQTSAFSRRTQTFICIAYHQLWFSAPRNDLWRQLLRDLGHHAHADLPPFRGPMEKKIDQLFARHMERYYRNIKDHMKDTNWNCKSIVQ